MGLGAARSQGSAGESINHTTGLRIRVVGVGNLNLKFHSLDDVFEYDLGSLAMQSTTNKEPFVLANVLEQRTYLEGFTTQCQEVFNINRIIIFTKPVFTMHPG